MHYNVDGITDEKITFIGKQAGFLKLDLIHLVDTRVSTLMWPSVQGKLIAAMAGTKMKWLFKFVEGGMGGPSADRCTIGGQIVCYTNRLSRVTVEPVVKLGAAVCLLFNLNKIQYASIGTYWPCPNNEGGSFQSLLESAYGGLSAISLLKVGITMAAEAAIAAGRTVLVGGDFNSDMTDSGQFGLCSWVADSGLHNASAGSDALIPSFRRVGAQGLAETRIDHVFTSDPESVLSSLPVSPDMLVTLHLFSLTRLSVGYCARKELYQGIKRVNMMHSATNRSNRIGEVCRRIEEDDLLDWDDPEKFLTFIGVETVKVCTLSKGVRKEKNGWSPVTKGLTMNLRAIVTMLKHVRVRVRGEPSVGIGTFSGWRRTSALG
jgi:hypothetical protein